MSPRPITYTYRPGILGHPQVVASGVHDPSVVGVEAELDQLYARTSEYAPKTLAKLNELVESYGAAFSHAWNFQEASGNVLDLATSGAIPLVPTDAPTQNVSTGLTDYVTDKGAQFADLADSRFVPANVADLDAAQSLIVFLRARFLSNAVGASHGVIGKGGGVPRWSMLLATNGTLGFSMNTAEGGTGQSTAGTHVSATDYVDVLAIIDRTSASKLLSINTNLENRDAIDISALTSTLAGSAHKFGIGEIPNLIQSCAMIMSFAAWGTVPGTLVANRVAALAAITDAFNSPREMYAKYGAADTAWGLVNP